MTEFMNEMRRIREEKPSEKDMADAKRSIVAGFALSLENPGELLQYATTLEDLRPAGGLLGHLSGED